MLDPTRMSVASTTKQWHDEVREEEEARESIDDDEEEDGGDDNDNNGTARGGAMNIAFILASIDNRGGEAV